MKLWGGRFKAATNSAMEDFHSSISFDARLFEQDIEGSIAHASMLGRQGIISAQDAESICNGLALLLIEIKDGKIEFSKSAEDIHMNVETLLTERIGAVAKKLHTGRSRNDQVALDTRMYLRGCCGKAIERLHSLQSLLVSLAEQHIKTVMPGYTHMQKAQPITLAHHLMAYFEMFERDKGRFSDCLSRMNFSPLGCGALAGSTFDLDREYVADKLGFDGICRNSLDGVSDRDFTIEFAFCSSMVMMHLSRFCEELIIWNTDEFKFVAFSDAFSTGSSIMPQKKNPDAAELIRGKTGRVYGDLMALLSVMKSLPLAYNKDMQEDKEAAFDAVDTLLACLEIFKGMLEEASFNDARMASGAAGGFTNATDAADYLVKKGLAFREAHEIIGKMVLYCIESGKSIHELTMPELTSFSNAISADFFDAVSLEKCISERDLPGGPAPKAVLEHIAIARELLGL